MTIAVSRVTLAVSAAAMLVLAGGAAVNPADDATALASGSTVPAPGPGDVAQSSPIAASPTAASPSTASPTAASPTAAPPSTASPSTASSAAAPTAAFRAHRDTRGGRVVRRWQPLLLGERGAQLVRRPRPYGRALPQRRDLRSDLRARPPRRRLAIRQLDGDRRGGPWVTAPDPATGLGTVVGVIGGYERGGDTPHVSYSAYFDDDVQQLYSSATS